MEQIKQLLLPTPTFNVAKYDIVRTDSGDKRSFLENPDTLEDEMTVESYEAGIDQQYQAIETALQNVANLTAQKEKLERFLVDNPAPVAETAQDV